MNPIRRRRGSGGEGGNVNAIRKKLDDSTFGLLDLGKLRLDSSPASKRKEAEYVVKLKDDSEKTASTAGTSLSSSGRGGRRTRDRFRSKFAKMDSIDSFDLNEIPAIAAAAANRPVVPVKKPRRLDDFIIKGNSGSKLRTGSVSNASSGVRSERTWETNGMSVRTEPILSKSSKKHKKKSSKGKKKSKKESSSKDRSSKDRSSKEYAQLSFGEGMCDCAVEYSKRPSKSERVDFDINNDAMTEAFAVATASLEQDDATPNNSSESSRAQSL